MAFWASLGNETESDPFLRSVLLILKFIRSAEACNPSFAEALCSLSSRLRRGPVQGHVAYCCVDTPLTPLPCLLLMLHFSPDSEECLIAERRLHVRAADPQFSCLLVVLCCTSLLPASSILYRVRIRLHEITWCANHTRRTFSLSYARCLEYAFYSFHHGVQ